MVAACVLAVVLLALFTREPAGRFRHLDRALVSKSRCNMADKRCEDRLGTECLPADPPAPNVCGPL